MNEHAMLDGTCWMKQLECKIRFHATFEFSSNIHPTFEPKCWMRCWMHLPRSLDYLFNELNGEDYYEPKEIKSAFDGSYMLYESRGDKDNKLALYEYFDIVRPYLKDMIDNHKGEWKIQYQCK